MYCEQTALFVELKFLVSLHVASDILSPVSFLPETLSLPRLSVPTSPQLGKENNNGNNRLLAQKYIYKIWQYREWIKINKRKYFTQL